MAQLVKRIYLQCGRPEFDPWVGKILLGEGKGYSLQYSGLENSMDCIVHVVTKELDTTERLSRYINIIEL